MRISTHFTDAPIGMRDYDWLAIDDDSYEPGCPIGYGATRGEAIANLMAKLGQRFGPDNAAVDADRGENHDPGASDIRRSEMA
jgi:hypothetical protein